MTIDPALAWAFRLALAALWLRAAYHKWADLDAFRASVADYRLLWPEAVPAAALGLALCELAVGVGLVVPMLAPVAAWGGAGLLGLYAGAIIINLARGRRDLDCGCAGPAATRPVGEGLVARNFLLAVVSLAAALPVAARSLAWVDAFSIAAAAATLALLHVAADTALANALQSRVLQRRTWSTR